MKYLPTYIFNLLHIKKHIIDDLDINDMIHVKKTKETIHQQNFKKKKRQKETK